MLGISYNNDIRSSGRDAMPHKVTLLNFTSDLLCSSTLSFTACFVSFGYFPYFHWTLLSDSLSFTSFLRDEINQFVK